MLRSQSIPPRWLRIGFEVPLLCSGNFGSWQVSCFTFARFATRANCRTKVFSWASAPTSLLKTLVISLGVSNSVPRLFPSFVLGCGIWFCPESPRWLMKKEKIAKAFRSMDRLRSHSIIAARDFYYSYVIYQEEIKQARGAGYFARLWDCFAVPRIRRSNYGASTVMIAQQMCGINSALDLCAMLMPALTLHSHLFLQLHYFPRSWLHS